MVFAHDTEESLACAAALINTVDETDSLTTPEELDAFLRTWPFTGTIRHTRAELAEVRKLRGRLRALWQADEAEVVTEVNVILREAGALPQLVKHDEWDWHLHATAADAPLATRMAVEVAMAFIDVVRGKQLGRLRLCAYPTCDRVLLDLSKNHSRRFCDAGCSNLAAVHAYRARKREA